MEYDPKVIGLIKEWLANHKNPDDPKFIDKIEGIHSARQLIEKVRKKSPFGVHTYKIFEERLRGVS